MVNHFWPKPVAFFLPKYNVAITDSNILLFSRILITDSCIRMQIKRDPLGLRTLLILHALSLYVPKLYILLVFASEKSTKTCFSQINCMLF